MTTVALCLYGLPSDVQEGAHNWKNFIMTENPSAVIKVFSHSWKVPSGSKANHSEWPWLNGGRGKSIGAVVSDNVESDLLEVFSPEEICEVVVDPQEDFEWFSDEVEVYFRGTCVSDAMRANAPKFYSQMASRERCAAIFEKQTENFDWVMTGRYDLHNVSNTNDYSATETIPRLYMLSNELIYTSGFRIRYQNDFIVPDNFLLMSPKNYLSVFRNISRDIRCLYENISKNLKDFYETRECVFDPESLISEQMVRKGLIKSVRRRLGLTLHGVSVTDFTDDYEYYSQYEFEIQERERRGVEFHPIFYTAPKSKPSFLIKITAPLNDGLVVQFNDNAISSDPISIIFTGPDHVSIGNIFPDRNMLPPPPDRISVVSFIDEIKDPVFEYTPFAAPTASIETTGLHLSALKTVSDSPKGGYSYVFPGNISNGKKTKITMGDSRFMSPAFVFWSLFSGNVSPPNVVLFNKNHPELGYMIRNGYSPKIKNTHAFGFDEPVSDFGVPLFVYTETTPIDCERVHERTIVYIGDGYVCEYSIRTANLFGFAVISVENQKFIPDDLNGKFIVVTNETDFIVNSPPSRLIEFETTTDLVSVGGTGEFIYCQCDTIKIDNFEFNDTLPFDAKNLFYNIVSGNIDFFLSASKGKDFINIPIYKNKTVRPMFISCEDNIRIANFFGVAKTSTPRIYIPGVKINVIGKFAEEIIKQFKSTRGKCSDWILLANDESVCDFEFVCGSRKFFNSDTTLYDLFTSNNSDISMSEFGHFHTSRHYATPEEIEYTESNSPMVVYVSNSNFDATLVKSGICVKSGIAKAMVSAKQV